MKQIYPKESGIYILWNTINDKIYVGSAKDFSSRLRRHFSMLRNGNHTNSHLRNASLKYGVDSFIWLIQEIVEDPEKLLEREEFWIKELKPEYNLTEVSPTMLGFKHTEESRKKMSEASRSRGARPPSRKGISPTPEAIEKQREKLIGKPRPQWVKDKIKATKMANPYVYPPEIRKKMSLAKVRKTFPKI